MSLKELLSKSKNILIIAKSVDNFDKACAVIGVTNVISGMDKKVDLLITGKVPSTITTLFEKHNSLYITEIRPVSFEITIDYGSSSVEKIIYDDIVAERKLKFLITPGDSNFTFDNVILNQAGAMYDLTILVDIPDSKKLKKIYDENEYLFKDLPTISVGSVSYPKADIDIVIEDGASYAETVYNNLRDSKVDIGKDGVEILLNGIINHRKVLEGNVSSNSWEVVSSMLSDGADLSKSLKEVYFSKSSENTKLQMRMMQKAKVNEQASLLWSLVSKQDVDKIGITKDQLDLRGRIPFNISQEYRMAFVGVEFEDGVYTCFIESNQPEEKSALAFARLFGGNGDDSHAVCDIKYWKKTEFEKKLVETIEMQI